MATEIFYMRVVLLIMVEMASENIIMIMVNIILDNGKMIHQMAEVYYTIKMGRLNMKVISSTENLKDMENIIMMTVNLILGNLKIL